MNRFTQALQEGRLASDRKMHDKTLARAVRKAGPHAPKVVVKVVSSKARILMRFGWTLESTEQNILMGTSLPALNEKVLSFPNPEYRDALTG